MPGFHRSSTPVRSPTWDLPHPAQREGYLNSPDKGSVTASFGVVALPDEAGESEALIRKADRALYAAKAAGRNRVEPARQGEMATSSSPA
jgi:GGDEF domain-containing protein